MEILNQMDLKAWHIDITCDACQSRLRIFTDDVQAAELGGDYTGDGSYKGYLVTCAACGGSVVVHRDVGDPIGTRLPLLVRQDADRRRAERLERQGKHR